jgi:hypothetical protein
MSRSALFWKRGLAAIRAAIGKSSHQRVRSPDMPCRSRSMSKPAATVSASASAVVPRPRRKVAALGSHRDGRDRPSSRRSFSHQFFRMLQNPGAGSCCRAESKADHRRQRGLGLAISFLARMIRRGGSGYAQEIGLVLQFGVIHSDVSMESTSGCKTRSSTSPSASFTSCYSTPSVWNGVSPISS